MHKLKWFDVNISIKYKMEADPFHKNQFLTEQTPKQFQGFETQFAKTNHNTGNPFHPKG